MRLSDMLIGQTVVIGIGLDRSLPYDPEGLKSYEERLGPREKQSEEDRRYHKRYQKENKTKLKQYGRTYRKRNKMDLQKRRKKPHLPLKGEVV